MGSAAYAELYTVSFTGFKIVEATNLFVYHNTATPVIPL